MSSDLELWRAYTRKVTPLGQPVVMAPPCRRLPAPPIEYTLDLHGMSLSQAYTATSKFLSRHVNATRYVTVITGLSGRIHHEFRHWLDGHPIQRVEELRGGGGFRLYFRKH